MTKVIMPDDVDFVDSQPIIFTPETYCDFYKKKTLFISIHLTLKDISQHNLTTISTWYFCVCHSVDKLVAGYSQKLR